ncbi:MULTISPECIES: hypothetical protein [Actinoplanes]|uniref:hypothetical protein n=1 Tax=Actinoplanes TaxID=1865 RepID=UPI0009FB8C65|nr:MULTISPECIES: hypothetical protein [Actinoplanes]GLY03727.1 hypothetical protein Acsp01_41060 [Actinoplanes sp. NBRC 101535]
MDQDIFLEIKLTADEGLVLSDWLYNLQDRDLLLDDEAVRTPLRRIGAALEKKLVAVFAPDYTERVEAARRRLISDLD